MMLLYISTQESTDSNFFHYGRKRVKQKFVVLFVFPETSNRKQSSNSTVIASDLEQLSSWENL